jgi:formylglycine-generating enzyme required for sulfatase activity
LTKTPVLRSQAATGGAIRLPTEWEWQWAATGGRSEFEYPWGPEWDGDRTNTWESGSGRAVAVGLYPQGASPYGVLDMSGNVEEWCLNKYGRPENTGLRGGGARVVRGGSWCLDRDSARAADRLSRSPGAHDYRIGFRVVCCPPSH